MDLHSILEKSHHNVQGSEAGPPPPTPPMPAIRALDERVWKAPLLEPDAGLELPAAEAAAAAAAAA